MTHASSSTHCIDDHMCMTVTNCMPQGCCYGCGAKLQIDVPLGPGYVKADKYESKKKHRQLDKVRRTA